MELSLCQSPDHEYITDYYYVFDKHVLLFILFLSF